MSRIQAAKYSFAGGVRTPRVSLRSDHNPYTDRDTYNESLEIGNNWIITPQGGIQFREGFKNMIESPDTGNDGRIFQFHRGGDVSDIEVHVTASDGLVHFYGINDATGAILEYPYSVSHNYLQSELEDLWFTNQEKTAIILHPNHPPLYIEIQLDGTIDGAELPAESIPFHDYDDAASPTATTTGDADYSLDFVDGVTNPWNPSRHWTLRYDGVFATGNKGAIKEFEFSSVAATLAGRVQNALEFIPALKGSGTTITVVPGLAGTDWTLIEVTIAGEGGGKTLELFSANESADRYVEVAATVDEFDVMEPAWSFPTYVLEAGTYYQCILAHTPAVGNQPPNATYWTPLAGKPDSFDWQYPSGNAWSVAEVQYSPGGRGFPTVGVVYEQRVLLMANPALGMGVFGSRIAQYKDFVLGPQDDDPLFFAIDTSDSPKIKWAQAQRKLIIGTSSGDYALQSDITLTPSNVQATRQNSARSHGTNGVSVNTDIFYIQQGREKMRMTSYNDNIQSQTSQDISLVAQNLLETRVKRLCLMETPEVLIFGLRADGTLICISYSPEQLTAAWSELTCAGTVIDICGGYNAFTSEDELWAVVTYDNGASRWIEKMPYPARVKTIRVDPADDALVDQNIVCLDGWITGTIASGDNNIITGLEQFNGLVVTAMVDDAYVGQYTVVTGAIQLDAPPPGDVPTYSGTYSVGFEYTAPAKTFEAVSGNPKGVGFGTKRRWAKLTVRLLDSALPKINGQLPYDRHPVTEMSVAEIIREGKQDLEITNTEWGDGSITILQDRPYPTHILGFFGRLEVEDA